MHEIGLCESILAVVRQRAEGRAVDRLKVRIGVRHGVAEPALRDGFALVATGTTADGAEIELVTVPALVVCRSCGGDGETLLLPAICGDCGSAQVTVYGGDDLILEELHLIDRAVR
ncbi:hydrogenase maturation nickel metallochaperone HypA [Catellatospora sp. KI3]|uniref:hydrogenase maturation nickel metallochaperone HypA/HybF n=1 Tax=Catellatospora sp. KI3 TaxID=3041620 RepID=UPI002482A199|nr:hydrogenase maturation nickel metallochaperone HypA [Catellatospora sp. KI3]MDI1465676.1 hydrogenase maturation nickel metallochaperone HypA [Catellatospora sp. KI3]